MRLNHLRLAAVLLGVASIASAQSPPDAGWPTYGNDPGGARYSPVAQIDRSNVGRLRVTWTYRTGALQPESALNRKAAFEATPIQVDGTLFLSTPFNQVIALDARTGAQRWVYDPAIDRSRGYSEVTSRGVSAWRDGKVTSGQRCALRIFAATLDARLIALDGDTGRLCPDFGVNGQIDLTRGVDLRDLGQYQVTSAPAIAGDVVITGSSIGDNRAVDVERGIVRAFDARTGALRWSWDPIPWASQTTPRTGAGNAWSTLSVDAERGLVGGVNWGSGAYDPQRHLLVVNTNRLAFHVRLIPREKLAEEPARANQAGGVRAELAEQRGTRYGMARAPLLAPGGRPCNAPPWGTVAAVDLFSGAVRWDVPLGSMVPGVPTGTPNLGGPIVTAGGLVFTAAAMDGRLRAFDSETGKELWAFELPAGGQATPMTYSLDGKQYLVIAAGGHGKIGTKLGDYVIGFALP